MAKTVLEAPRVASETSRSGFGPTKKAEQTTIVLFGGTGDLARRKLFPALFNLWDGGELEDCLIVGVGRRVRDTAAYHAMLRDAEVVGGLASSHPEKWSRFERLVEFHHGEIATEADFVSLRAFIEQLEQERGLPGDRLFYFAVGPRWFGPITERLAGCGLITRAVESPADRWSRIVVEKPFGRDLASARELDGQLHARVDESQIYRIDHYLGKETVQNIIAFRFANGLFEPIWNHKYIDHVQITVAETVGVEDRAPYYEHSGALRDMMQNHMLQVLAITAMEPPNSLDPDAVRNEKVKTLQAIRMPANAAEVADCTVRGQYGPGAINGVPVPGYREEPGVAADSATPTYVAARLFLDTWRWAGVPFLLRHGKRLPTRATEIAIQFNTPPLALFRGTDVPGVCTNLLIIRIQPDEGISLQFGAKVPGTGMRIGNVRMDFSYEESFEKRIPGGYERLLLDALIGDPTLFTRTDEVHAMWRWADTLLEGWETLGAPAYPNYAAGSWGPADAGRIFPETDDAKSGGCPIRWREL